MVTPYFTYLFSCYTLFNCIKKIVQSHGYVGQLGLVEQSNSSNCLVLIPHRQLGNFWINGETLLPKCLCFISLRVPIFG